MKYLRLDVCCVISWGFHLSCLCCQSCAAPASCSTGTRRQQNQKKKRCKGKEKNIPWLLLCLVWLLLRWGSRKYYHHGPGFNCSRFFLCICRALLLLFLYIQAKPGICFHLQQEMQPEAERSPETRAKEELCPGSYISYITGIFHACYRNPQIPGIIPGSLGVTTTFVTGVPSYLKTAGEMGNCHFWPKWGATNLEEKLQVQCVVTMSHCSITTCGIAPSSSCQDQQEGIKTNTDDPKESTCGVILPAGGSCSGPSSETRRENYRDALEVLKAGLDGTWSNLGRESSQRKDSQSCFLLQAPEVSFFCLFFVICPRISLLLCCQDLHTNYTQTAAGHDHHCQQQGRPPAGKQKSLKLITTCQALKTQWISTETQT